MKNKLTVGKIQYYIQKLRERGESESGVRNKLETVYKFFEWAHRKDIIDHSLFKQIVVFIADNNKAGNTGFKGNQAQGPKEFFLRRLFKKIPSLHAKSKPPESFQLPVFGIQQYILFGIILIFMALLGAGAYYRFFQKNQQTFAYPTSLTRAGRLLSFQGRLTDTLGNPISTATNVTYNLYNVSTGGSSLYTAGACSTTPDQDGIFNVLICGSGYSPTPPQSVCGTEVPASIFT